METTEIILLIEQYGYLALFFCLWLGIVGMPIPDEVIVMTGGLVGSLGLLNTPLAFLVTYLGVVSGLTIGYFLGRIIGAPILQRAKLRKMSKYINKSSDLIAKYGSFALVVSYFLPVVRHVIPYLVGINNMPYKKYVAFSYTTGFVWTFIYFQLGIYFGNHSKQIVDMTYKYGLGFIIILISLYGVYTFYSRFVMGENQNAKGTDISH